MFGRIANTILLNDIKSRLLAHRFVCAVNLTKHSHHDIIQFSIMGSQLYVLHQYFLTTAISFVVACVRVGNTASV